VPAVVAALAERARIYGEGCRAVDALVYGDLLERYLMP
jgi:hypothetical protein